MLFYTFLTAGSTLQKLQIPCKYLLTPKHFIMKKIFHFLLVVFFLLAGSTITWTQPTNSSGLMFTSSSGEALSTFREGLKFDDLSDTRKARALFQKAVQQDPKLAIAYLYLCNYAVTPQEWADNIHKAKENLSGTNDWEKLYYDYMETALKEDFDKRLVTAQKMVALFPTVARAYELLGQAYSNRKDFANARLNYQKAISVEPSWPAAYRSLATSYLFEEPKDFKKAEEHANSLIKLAPTSAGYILLGDAYRAQNDLRKAELTYARAVELDMESYEALYKRGHARSFLGEYETAREDYRKAATLDVMPTFAMELIANTYLYEGKPEQALRFLSDEAAKTAQMSDPVQAATSKYFFLNDIFNIAFHTGNTERLNTTIALLEPLSEQMGNSLNDPDAKLIESGYLLSWKALVDVAAKDFKGAWAKAEELKTILEPIKNPNKLEGYEYVLGQIAYRQMDYKKAVDHFAKTNLQNVYNKYWLAKAYDGAAQKEKASTIYKELANYNFNDIGYALIRNEVRKKK